MLTRSRLRLRCGFRWPLRALDPCPARCNAVAMPVSLSGSPAATTAYREPANAARSRPTEMIYRQRCAMIFA